MKGKASQPTHDETLPCRRAPLNTTYMAYRPGAPGAEVRRLFVMRYGAQPAEVFVDSVDGMVRAGPVGAPAASPAPAVVATAEPLETESSSIAGQQLELL